MAVGTTALVLGALGIGGGLLANKLMTPKQSSPSSPMALPEPPKPEVAQDKAMDIARKKRAAMSQSVYTSPLGTAGEANVARKSLLGQ